MKTFIAKVSLKWKIKDELAIDIHSFNTHFFTFHIETIQASKFL